MKKLIRKAVKKFKQLADKVLLVFGQNVSTGVANNAKTFPEPTPGLEALNAELATFAACIEAAKNKDQVQVTLKNQSRVRLLALLSQLCDYVNLVCLGDPALLQLSNFSLNKIPESIKITAPKHVVIMDGAKAGELCLKFNKVRGASSYIYLCSTDPLMESKDMISVPATTTSYTFTGLSRGVTYYCMAIAVGGNKQQMPGIIVNRVSQ